jgi:hypothetical protein
MSWIVEQSEDTSAVTVNGDSVTCTKNDYYGSPINVMYNDPADGNGDYFWQIEIQDVDEQGGNSVSVGLTIKRCFQSGWGLKAMKYLGRRSSLSLHASLIIDFIDFIDFYSTTMYSR